MSSLRVLTSLTAALLAGCATMPDRPPGTGGAPARLRVHIEGVRGTQGRLLVFLHDNAGDYHADDDTTAPDFHAFRYQRVDPVVPRTTVVFEDVPAGRYAVSAYHDEDGDGRLDRMWFPFPLMPSEPYAIANGAFAPVSKPAFTRALIDVEPPSTDTTLSLSTHLEKLLGGP